jgi:uncharacterized membrane protein SirB2
MSYLALKLVHVSCVALSISLFFLRGVWMLRHPERLRQRWVGIVPHLIDSTLLGSAILLALTTQQYPGVHGWLTAKIVALLVYIGLGTVAIKRGKTREIRLAAWLGAMAVFAYIVAVALSRNPLPLG